MEKSGLDEAWESIVQFLKHRYDSLSRDDRAEYLDFISIYIGTSRKSLDRWIDNGIPSTIEKNKLHVEKILKLYSFVAKAEAGSWHVASALGKALDLRNTDFAALENYRGDFRIYRKGKDGLIIGDVKIDNNNSIDPWMHYHSSLQNGINFYHKGPIYHVNGRIYMLGIGVNDNERYFRPMIFKAQDRPHTSVTFGILLTELANTYLPLSAKVALVSKKDSRIENSDFISNLSDRLKIESDTNVIYGAESTRL